MEQVGGRDRARAVRRPAPRPTRRARAAPPGRSPCGSAWAIDPPMVPRVRTWRSPIPAGGLGQHRAAAAHDVRRGDLVVAGQRPDRDPVRRLAHASQASRSRRCRSAPRAPRAAASSSGSASDRPPAAGRPRRDAAGHRPRPRRSPPARTRTRWVITPHPFHSSRATPFRAAAACRGRRTPTASQTAPTTAAVAAIVPASPMPFTPIGLTGDGVTVRCVSITGISTAEGMR